MNSCGHRSTGWRWFRNAQGGTVMLCTHCYLAIVKKHEDVIRLLEEEVRKMKKDENMTIP